MLQRLCLGDTNDYRQHW